MRSYRWLRRQVKATENYQGMAVLIVVRQIGLECRITMKCECNANYFNATTREPFLFSRLLPAHWCSLLARDLVYECPSENGSRLYREWIGIADVVSVEDHNIASLPRVCLFDLRAAGGIGSVRMDRLIHTQTLTHSGLTGTSVARSPGDRYRLIEQFSASLPIQLTGNRHHSVTTVPNRCRGYIWLKRPTPKYRRRVS